MGQLKIRFSEQIDTPAGETWKFLKTPKQNVLSRPGGGQVAKASCGELCVNQWSLVGDGIFPGIDLDDLDRYHF